MAKNDIEVEIKILLEEDSFLKVKEQMKKTAKFVKNSHQVDEYFTPAHRNFIEQKFPFEWLSIRKRGDKTILSYKHYYPEDADIKTHCDEFETEINNPDKIEKIFSALNLKKLVKVEKEREVYIHNDEFEIALDVVSELGNFIEIESMKDFGGVEATREKLFEFAANLGLDVSKADKRGYPFLLMRKKGLMK